MQARRPFLLVLAAGMLVGSPSRGQGPVGAPRIESERDDFADEETEEDEIETDRDSFTPATTTAGYGRTIFEAAHSFIDNRAHRRRIERHTDVRHLRLRLVILGRGRVGLRDPLQHQQ